MVAAVPSISIILLEITGLSDTNKCLESILGFDLPCHAVLRRGNSDLVKRYPSVDFSVSDGSVPLRRRHGVFRARSDIVVIIEDTTIPNPSMINGLKIAFSDENCGAASGPVDISEELESRYQALACTEYGRYYSEIPRDSTVVMERSDPLVMNSLPGNFMCYRRKLIVPMLSENNTGFIEGEINKQLLLMGKKLLYLPELSSKYVGKDDNGIRLTNRFFHGWIYSGFLVKEKRLLFRTKHAIKSLLLPLVLSTRSIKSMYHFKNIRKRLPVGVWIILMESFWSAGELTGCVVGRPPDLISWR